MGRPKLQWVGIDVAGEIDGAGMLMRHVGPDANAADTKLPVEDRGAVAAARYPVVDLHCRAREGKTTKAAQERSQ